MAFNKSRIAGLGYFGAGVRTIAYLRWLRLSLTATLCRRPKMVGRVAGGNESYNGAGQKGGAKVPYPNGY